MKHILNQIFDKIFLINLDRREDRWIECKKSLDSNGIEVERLSAVDGLELSEDQLNYQMLNHIPESNLRGQHGCIMSHFKGISLAKERNYKNVLQKAYQGFILTPDNYDNDPHVQEFVGAKMNTVVKDEKGKKIN